MLQRYQMACCPLSTETSVFPIIFREKRKGWSSFIPLGHFQSTHDLTPALSYLSPFFWTLPSFYPCNDFHPRTYFHSNIWQILNWACLANYETNKTTNVPLSPQNFEPGDDTWGLNNYRKIMSNYNSVFLNGIMPGSFVQYLLQL